MCAAASRPWGRIVAAVHYRDEAAALLARWKYGPEPWLSRPLGHLLTQALRHELVDLPDLVVPIPQSDVAWRERGFSPAQDLARALARAHERPVRHPLVRDRRAPAQVGLTAAQRRRNVDRLFRVPALRARALRGRHALLVDDVVTTTATIGAAARQLRRAGCDRVTVAALGRSPAERAD